MKSAPSAKFDNRTFRLLDTEQLPIPEGAVVSITVVDEPPWDDPGWMKKLLDHEEAERYLNTADGEAVPRSSRTSTC